MTEYDKIKELDNKIDELTKERQSYISSLGLKDLINSVPELKGLELNKSCCIEDFGRKYINGILKEVNYDSSMDDYILKFNKAVVISLGVDKDSITYYDDFGARYEFHVSPGYHKEYNLVTEEEFDNNMKWKLKSFKYMIKNIRKC